MNRRTRRKSRQIGGILQQQGSYGCGFFPGFKCKIDRFRDKNIFSKLMKTHVAEKELQIVEHVKKADPNMKYCIYPYKMCHPSEDDMKEMIDEGLLKCAIVEHRDSEMLLKMDFEANKYAILQQKYGGRSLDTYIQLFKNKNLTSGEIYKYFFLFSNIFKGLDHLHKQNIVHFDINDRNLVVSDSKMYLIDFGLSQNLKTYIPGNKSFDSESPFYFAKLYDPYPYDSLYIKGWSKLFEKSEEPKIDLRVLNEFVGLLYKSENDFIPKHVYMGEFYDDDFIPFTDFRDYIEMYENIFSNILKLNQNNKKIISTSIRNYLFKQVDVYSLGFTLCKLTYYLTKKEFTVDGKIRTAKKYGDSSSVPNDLVKDLYILGIKMMHPDPLKRLSSTAALIEYTEILKRMPIGKPITKIIDKVEGTSEGFDPYIILQSLLDI